MDHRTLEELDAGIAHVEAAPDTDGTLDLIVRRPAIDEREVLPVGELSLEDGLVGDSWLTRAGDEPNFERQLTVINARFTALVAGAEDRWALAGDQLYVDFDLSIGNIPAGSRISVGDAVIEVTDLPHTGCHKFTARFGVEARRFVNSEVGRSLRLRGLNAKVVVPGTIRRGDRVRKLS